MKQNCPYCNKELIIAIRKRKGKSKKYSFNYKILGEDEEWKILNGKNLVVKNV